ncbi:Leucine-rich repeat-containing protein 47 [Fasciola hepatica]|uniref:Leucine-rich repeat-containing protein 47 n=1 Tax=Fasciola hepatica TaxID=6192 RepID=A0A4E0RAJ8_FASHE|nr:Leucine-rich repeat-containing protein 47 [Fasciola hepatica]
MHLLGALSTVDFSHNKLSTLSDELQSLGNLKTADFSNNDLSSLPTNLHRCRKLHVLKVQNNPLKDSRLRKLANDPKASKPLLEYLRRLDENAQKGKKSRVKNNSTTETENAQKLEATVDVTDVKAASTTGEDVEVTSKPPASHPHIVIERPDDSELYRVSQTSSVKDGPRPYLVVCTVHGVRFKSEAQLKAFTRAQEEWHKEIGQMRRRATLATHDLNAVRFPLLYTMRQSDQIQFHVLNNNEPTTGDRFLLRLYQDAEADRKSRKQAKFSQLYRYLNMLNLDPTEARDGFRDHMIPVVEDARKTVISVPPLSNCNQTRLTVKTTSILIEVTGIQLNACKEFAETVISWLLEHTVPPPATDPHVESVPLPAGDVEHVNGSADTEEIRTRELVIPSNVLLVRPVRVVDSESASKLSSLFPSRLDLVAAKFGTVR